MDKISFEGLEQAYKALINDRDFLAEMSKDEWLEFLSYATVEENQEFIQEILIPFDLWTQINWTTEYINEQIKEYGK